MPQELATLPAHMQPVDMNKKYPAYVPGSVCTLQNLKQIAEDRCVYAYMHIYIYTYVRTYPYACTDIYIYIHRYMQGYLRNMDPSCPEQNLRCQDTPKESLVSSKAPHGPIVLEPQTLNLKQLIVISRALKPMHSNPKPETRPKPQALSGRSGQGSE